LPISLEVVFRMKRSVPKRVTARCSHTIVADSSKRAARKEKEFLLFIISLSAVYF